jgi:hypothetical protein
MVLLQIDVQRFAVLRFKGDTPRAVHVDRIAPGRAAQRVKIEPGGAAHGDAQEQFEDTAHANATIRCVAAGRRDALNSYRGVRVRVGAIFDVRALLMPPLAAERIVRLSTRMGFRAEVLA